MGSERHLSAAEAAKALGVSTRTLKFYEQQGLVKPLRSEAGWRAYGTEALTRLHQILALKHMGLELSKIAQLLKGSLASLDSVLALQEENLAARQAETHRALDLVRRTRARLSSGETLSVDDLTTLTRETIMDGQALREMYAKSEREKDVKAFALKYHTPEDLERIKVNREQPGYYEAAAEAFASMQAAMKSADPKSPEALEAARKLRVMEMRFFGGDLDLMKRNKRMMEAMAGDPAALGAYNKVVANTMFTPEFLAFSQQATKALEAKEAEAPRKGN